VTLAHTPMTISTGDLVRVYDGVEATVRDVKCPQCEVGVSHEECGVFAQVSDTRWVNIKWLEKL
jgi:DNA-binding IscR family transcriptional regulator